MVSATILTPPSTGLNGDSAFRQIPIFLKDQNMKNINTISMHREKFYQIHKATMTAVVTSK